MMKRIQEWLLNESGEMLPIAAPVIIAICLTCFTIYAKKAGMI